ncbi:PDDEXK family nuclease [Bacillus solitudinis]|uniref:DNA mismatch repair protein MutH n=1 Tax=Bacillus solitudinis TaxID=2014074 RepID=UPI000C2461D2|nr:DNA mismatch repair protein MutH [Bacillus solitudinis]
MKLLDALDKMQNQTINDIPFETLFKDISIDLINKGRIGQLLEILLGLQNGNSLTDFEDGELKTNKAKVNGLPIETMFITQLATQVDDLLNNIGFEESRLYQKINRLIYIPVVKMGEPTDWFFKKPVYFEMIKGDAFYHQLEEDFHTIIEQMKNHIKTDGQLHTSSGKYIQIRTKDSKPYRPIYSHVYNAPISNKNFAFYFKKSFMTDLLKKSVDYPDI